MRRRDLGKILCSTHLDTDKASWHGAAQVTPVENAPPPPPPPPRLKGGSFSQQPSAALSVLCPASVTPPNPYVGVFISFCIFSSLDSSSGMSTFAILTRPTRPRHLQTSLTADQICLICLTFSAYLRYQPFPDVTFFFCQKYMHVDILL